MLKFKSLLVVLFSLALVATACEKKEEASAEGADEAAAEKTEENAAEETDEAAEKTEGEAEEKAAEGEELAMVEVPKEGKEFDPAVEEEQIPAGAWYCDMGTVHYAAMEKGEGTCPVCHMKLKQKAEGGEKGAAKGEMGEMEDHEGHGH